MKRSLLFKLILCFIINISFFFLIINTLGSYLCDEIIYDGGKSIIADESNEIITTYIEPYLQKKINSKDLSQGIRNTAAITGDTIWFINSKGKVIIDTSDIIDKANNADIAQKDPDFLQNECKTPFSRAGFTSEESLYTVSSVKNGDSEYYIAVLRPVSTYDKIHYNFILFLNMLGLLFCPIVFLVFTLIYFLTIHPVHKITKAASEYSKGHFSYPLEIKANDEYHELGTAIQYMAGEMNNLDDYQRKFIGNISHDFRSPLTSIKGYIQAMLDGTIPKDNQEKYLNIILFEAERLSGLMTNLLTLNNFDHNKKQLERTNFDIINIIEKTAQTYEGVCEKKKISFEFHFEEPKYIVWADQPRIQQVLNNLIDNAIKFSPAYSKITLSTLSRNDKLFVSVKDNGIGIPSDSINRIWERFYKSDSSRGKDKKGTGLGLAITKEIITSHGETIDVISTEGVGTEFIFTLSPKHMSKVTG